MISDYTIAFHIALSDVTYNLMLTSYVRFGKSLLALSLFFQKIAKEYLLIFILSDIYDLRFEPLDLALSTTIYHTTYSIIVILLPLYWFPQITFFGRCLKKTPDYFLKFRFLFESTILLLYNGKYFHSNDCFAWPCSSLHDLSNFKAHSRLCAAVFHQWLHEYCPLKH